MDMDDDTPRSFVVPLEDLQNLLNPLHQSVHDMAQSVGRIVEGVDSLENRLKVIETAIGVDPGEEADDEGEPSKGKGASRPRKRVRTDSVDKPSHSVQQLMHVRQYISGKL